MLVPDRGGRPLPAAERAAAAAGTDGQKAESGKGGQPLARA